MRHAPWQTAKIRAKAKSHGKSEKAEQKQKVTAKNTATSEFFLGRPSEHPPCGGRAYRYNQTNTEALFGVLPYFFFKFGFSVF